MPRVLILYLVALPLMALCASPALASIPPGQRLPGFFETTVQFDALAQAYGLTTYTVDFTLLPDTPIGQYYVGAGNFFGPTTSILGGALVGLQDGRLGSIDGLFAETVASDPRLRLIVPPGSIGFGLYNGAPPNDLDYLYQPVAEDGITRITWAVGLATAVPEVSPAWALLAGLPLALLPAWRRRGRG